MVSIATSREFETAGRLGSLHILPVHSWVLSGFRFFLIQLGACKASSCLWCSCVFTNQQLFVCQWKQSIVVSLVLVLGCCLSDWWVSSCFFTCFHYNISFQASKILPFIFPTGVVQEMYSKIVFNFSFHYFVCSCLHWIERLQCLKLSATLEADWKQPLPKDRSIILETMILNWVFF